MKKLFQLPTAPITLIVIISINVMVIRNTPDEILLMMSEEEYSKRVSDLCDKLYFDKFDGLLDALSFVGWILIYLSLTQ